MDRYGHGAASFTHHFAPVAGNVPSVGPRCVGQYEVFALPFRDNDPARIGADDNDLTSAARQSFSHAVGFVPALSCCYLHAGATVANSARGSPQDIA